MNSSQPPAQAWAGSAPNQPAASPPSAPCPTAAFPAQPVVGGWVLVGISGPMAGARIPITGPTEVGREAPGLTLAGDTQASRRHALLTPSPDRVLVQDLGSTNGTWLNDASTPGAKARA